MIRRLSRYRVGKVRRLVDSMDIGPLPEERAGVGRVDRRICGTVNDGNAWVRGRTRKRRADASPPIRRGESTPGFMHVNTSLLTVEGQSNGIPALMAPAANTSGHVASSSAASAPPEEKP
jgi:hypothetical protein